MVQEGMRYDASDAPAKCFRYDVGAMGEVSTTPQGGLRIPATPTRAGVFPYRVGTDVRREYRPPSEVFNADSLASLRLAPVTDLHPERGGVRVPITTENWREFATGHMGENVRQDGAHVAGDVLIQDQPLIEKVRAGLRKDISCGYRCDLDMTPGVTPEGEVYDAIQRNIVYNHVALGPEGWGRAGPTASLRLDSNDGIQEQTTVEKETIDGKEYTVGTPEHVAALRAQAQREKGRADGLETKAKTLQAQAPDPKLIHALAQVRADLLVSCHMVAKKRGVTFDEKAAAASPNDAIVASLLTMIDPSFKVEGKSADYLMGALETMIKGLVGEEGGEVQGATDGKTGDPAGGNMPPAMVPGAASSVKTDSKVVDIFAARQGTKAPEGTKIPGDEDRYDSDKAQAESKKRNQTRGMGPLAMNKTP